MLKNGHKFIRTLKDAARFRMPIEARVTMFEKAITPQPRDDHGQKTLFAIG